MPTRPSSCEDVFLDLQKLSLGLVVVGPILSAPTYQQCITYGASEFPIDSEYDGMVIVDMECLEGVPVPPWTGSWDLFLTVEAPECGAVAPAQTAEQASRELQPSRPC